MEKKDHGAHIEALRGCSKSRAMLMYQFLEEAAAQGLDMETFGRKVIWDCGCMRAERSFPETDSIKEFTEVYQTEDWIKTFDSVLVENTEERLVVNSYYCPLLEAWESLTEDQQKRALVCDIAMDGDRALAHRYPNFRFEVAKTMAKGDPYCEVVVTKIKKEEVQPL